jgi:hypothetical protein
MSPLRLNGSTSGYSQLDAPAIAGDQTFTLPGTGGTIVTAAGAQTLTNKTIQGGSLTLATAQNSTSGTNIDFTGIPSWAKRVTVMFNEVSTSGVRALLIQIGASTGVETSGYIGSTATVNGGGTTWNTSGFLLYNAMNASNTLSGTATISLLSSNSWTLTGLVAMNTANSPCLSAGVKTLSGTLDRVRITTVLGTDTFDAGSINILYEG